MFGLDKSGVPSQQEPNFLNQDINVGILDLNLIRIVARNDGLSHVRRTFSQLKSNIANKNSAFNYTQTELNRASYDMSKQGVDIANLERELEARKYERKKEQQIKRDVEDCYFYLPSVSLNNFGDFRTKLFEYNMMAELQESLGKSDLSRDVRRRILGRTIGSSTESLDKCSTKPAPLSSKIKGSLSKRNENTQKKFNKIIAEYIFRNGRMTATQLARQFFNATSNNVVWAALVQQLEALDSTDQMRNNEVVRKLIDSSAKMIEMENSDMLPRQPFAVESYVKNSLLSDPETKKCYIYIGNYRSKADQKTNRPVWAIAYTLMKAGRLNDIIKMGQEVQKGEFLSDLQTYMKGTSPRQKYTWKGENSESDVFLDTIYSIFNKDSMVQRAVVKESTDLLWFVLKVIDIDNNTNNQFSLEELKKLMIQRNRQEQSSRSLINLLYSTCYDELLSEVSDRISIDDSTHMMIVLQKMGFMERKLVDKSKEEYTNLLLAYAQDVVTSGLEISINYLLLAYQPSDPQDSARKVLFNLQRVLFDRNLVEQFFGSYPRNDTKYQQQINQAIPGCNYSEVISTITSVYKKKFKYVYPALLYLNLLRDSTKSLDCLIEMRLGILNGSINVDEAELKNAGDLIVKLVRENRSKEQERLLAFIESYESMNEALAQKRFTEELNRNRFVPTTAYIDPELQQLLISLNSRGALRLYFLFFEMVLLALDAYCAIKADRSASAYKQRMQAYETLFRKLQDHTLVAANMQSLRPLLAKITSILKIV